MPDALPAVSSVSPALRRRRRLKVILSVAFLAALSGWFMLPVWVARAIVYAPNHGKAVSALALATEAECSALHVSRQLDLTVGSPPARLAIWLIDPDASWRAPPTVFLLHGIRDQKRSLLGMGRELASQGFRAVLVDLRGHGQSSGEWLSYGVREATDLQEVLDRLIENHSVNQPVGVYGASFGAATAIQWAGNDRRIAALVMIAPFCSMQEVVPISVRAFLPLGGWLSESWMSSVLDRAGKMASFDFRHASPREAIQRTSAPVLLIHGGSDKKIPAWQSEKLHEAARTHSSLILLPDEDHDTIMQDRSGTIGREGSKWFRTWLRPQSSAPAVF